MTEKWITERLHPFYKTGLLYQEKLHDEHSEYQHLQVFSTEFFGRVLVLDGIIQLTELDNPGYHEMIAHIPLLAHDNPKRVLIVGGGDGGTLQQILLHASVEQVVVCELDKRVIEVSQQFFPGFGEPFADGRVQLTIQDAFEYLQQTQHQFDVIIADTTDPIGPAEKLFTPQFYTLMVEALTPNGVAVTQCEQMYFDLQLIKNMVNIAKGLVKYPAYYHTLVPTYPAGGIGFLYMSDSPWHKGLDKAYPGKMKYLNAEIHKAAFALPEFLKTFLA